MTQFGEFGAEEISVSFAPGDTGATITTTPIIALR
jgi:hypothetical protein